ncbi:MAG: hypothetical protein ABW171_15385 [Steroidobacter sp.]
MTGYSGTPLAKKLGIQPGSQVHLISAPADYTVLVAPLPADVVFAKRVSEATDLVHLFVMKRAELSKSHCLSASST